MKTILTILTLALILSLIGNWLQYDLSKDSELGNQGVESARLSEIAHLKSNVAIRDKAVSNLQKKMDSTASINRVAQSGLKIEIKTIREKLRNKPDLKPEVVKLIDSVFVADDKLLASVENERDKIRGDCRQLTDSLLANAIDLTAIATKWETSYRDSEKRVAKEVKKRKWLVRGLIILGAAFVFDEVRQ